MKKTLRDGIPYVLDELTQELVQTAKELVGHHDQIGAIVLECTQFPPFAEAIQRATGLPVYDVFTLGSWFYSGLVRKPFPAMDEEERLDASMQRPRTERERMENEIKR